LAQASLVALLALLTPALLGASYEWGGPAARGVRQLRAGRNDEARASLRAGRSDLPHSAALRYDEGLALARTGRADSAAAAYHDALLLQGDAARASAAFNLGNLSMKTKRFAEAASWYREALRLEPGAADAKRNLEDALRRLRGEEPPKPPAGGGSGELPPPQAGSDSTRAPQGGGGTPGAPPGAGARGKGPAPPPPRTGSGDFTNQEAVHWLEALERERREGRHRAESAPRQPGGDRDW
jgi:tetratricopeptide (TPR) repeat protein